MGVSLRKLFGIRPPLNVGLLFCNNIGEAYNSRNETRILRCRQLFFPVTLFEEQRIKSRLHWSVIGRNLRADELGQVANVKSGSNIDFWVRYTHANRSIVRSDGAWDSHFVNNK